MTFRGIFEAEVAIIVSFQQHRIVWCCSKIIEEFVAECIVILGRTDLGYELICLE